MKTEAAPALAEFRSVTIVKPSSLGDVVHALPAVAALRAAMPGARFRWLVNTEWAPLIEGGPLMDEVIRFPRREFHGAAGWLKAARWLAGWRRLPRERPELVLDLQGLLRSGLAARARGGERVIGLSDAREGAAWLHDESVPVDAAAHAVDRCLQMPRALGVPLPEEALFPLAEGSRPAGWPEEDDEGVIVVHPFSRGAGKSLSEETLRALLAGLAPRRVAVVGSGAGLPGELPGHVTDLTGRTTLLELVWCLRRACFVVSVDSGPMHIAAAVNPDTLGLHTWTDPRKVGPYPARAWVWKAGRIAHRREFSEAECLREMAVDAAAARAVAEWVRGACF